MLNMKLGLHHRCDDSPSFATTNLHVPPVVFSSQLELVFAEQDHIRDQVHNVLFENLFHFHHQHHRHHHHSVFFSPEFPKYHYPPLTNKHHKSHSKRLNLEEYQPLADTTDLERPEDDF